MSPCLGNFNTRTCPDFSRNRIRNADFNEIGPDGNPRFFTLAAPITFDQPQINCCRTCSLTKASAGEATCTYNPLIRTEGCRQCQFGCVIRCIDADRITLNCTFLDVQNAVIQSEERPIRRCVNSDFAIVDSIFDIPLAAVDCRVQIRFTGSCTACSFYCPFCRLR